jgi:hypothetical protein
VSTFFRGPSLFTHVLVLAVIEAIAVPMALGASGRWLVAVGAGVGIGVVYLVGALVYGAGGRSAS